MLKQQKRWLQASDRDFPPTTRTSVSSNYRVASSFYKTAIS
jgi:hypothetical protein